MRILLAGLLAAAGLLATVQAQALSITTDQPPATSLADGRTGTIAFTAPTPKSYRDFIDRRVAETSTIAGVLTLPTYAKGPVPALVIVHGSSGVVPNDFEWAKRVNGWGIAAFVIDNFTGRGITETATDQGRLSSMADVAGALAALKLLATHPGIDPKRIGVLGFSRGGTVALDSAFEPLRKAMIDGDLRFAVHIPFYVSCSIPYVSAHLDGAPMLMLLGGKDDYTPSAPCLPFADRLRKSGEPVTVIVYPNAYHAFDVDMRVRLFPKPTSARNCHGQVDMDQRLFTMQHGGQTVSGAAAMNELRDCIEHGVMMGGDDEARAKAPGDVAAFLKANGMMP
ncbi:MAG TPA: dienelactone hydrolase family protein [Magnetospirillaceae bacterium]